MKFSQSRSESLVMKYQEGRKILMRRVIEEVKHLIYIKWQSIGKIDGENGIELEIRRL